MQLLYIKLLIVASCFCTVPELTLDEVKVQERIRTRLLNAGQLFELSSHHTLIIGLGGTGLRFAKATKKLLYQR
jgi:hypothetical protein